MTSEIIDDAVESASIEHDAVETTIAALDYTTDASAFIYNKGIFVVCTACEVFDVSEVYTTDTADTCRLVAQKSYQRRSHLYYRWLLFRYRRYLRLLA